MILLLVNYIPKQISRHHLCTSTSQDPSESYQLTFPLEGGTLVTEEPSKLKAKRKLRSKPANPQEKVSHSLEGTIEPPQLLAPEQEGMNEECMAFRQMSPEERAVFFREPARTSWHYSNPL